MLTGYVFEIILCDLIGHLWENQNNFFRSISLLGLHRGICYSTGPAKILQGTGITGALPLDICARALTRGVAHTVTLYIDYWSQSGQ